MKSNEKHKLKHLSWWVVICTILWLLLFWCVCSGGTLATTKIHVHTCRYTVRFVAPGVDPNEQHFETITIQVRRPVTLKRINDFWLQPNHGADLNEDGSVNFLDYAVWAGDN